MTNELLGARERLPLIRFSRADSGRMLVIYQDNRAISLLPVGRKVFGWSLKKKNPLSTFHRALLDITPHSLSFEVNDLKTKDGRPIQSLLFEYTVELRSDNLAAQASLLEAINKHHDKFFDEIVKSIQQDIRGHIRLNAANVDAETLQFDKETSLVDQEGLAFTRKDVIVTNITKAGKNYFAAHIVDELTKLNDEVTTAGVRIRAAEEAALRRKREMEIDKDVKLTEVKVSAEVAEESRKIRRRVDLITQDEEMDDEVRRQQHKKKIRAMHLDEVLDEAKWLGVDPFLIAHKEQWTTLVNANRAMAEKLIGQLGSGRISNDQLAAVIDYMRNPADVLPRERNEAARIIKEIDPKWKPSSQSAYRRTDVPGLLVNEDVASAWWRAGGDREALAGASFWTGQCVAAVLIVGNPKPVVPSTFHSRFAKLSAINVPIESEVVEGRTIREVIVAFTHMLARDRSKEITAEVRHRVLEKELVVELAGSTEDVRLVLEEITDQDLPYIPLLEGLVDPPVRVRFLPAGE